MNDDNLIWRIISWVTVLAVALLFLRAQVNAQDSVCAYASVRQMVPEVCGGWVEPSPTGA